MISTFDIAWCSGFMSADGCFTWSGGSRGKGGTPTVTVTQTNIASVEKFANIFGGSVKTYPHKRSKSGSIYRVQFYGKRAIGVMLTLFTHLSEAKRQDVTEVVTRWANTPSRGKRNQYAHKH